MTALNLIKEFNNNLRSFVCCIESANSTDTEIIMLKNSLMAALAASDLVGIINMGPYLYKYRVQIMAADEAFFMNADYSEYVDMQTLIAKAKSTWRRSSGDERLILQTQLQNMTVSYIKYCIDQKNKKRKL